MDQFIVSARKYRPQTFDTVVGQSHITTTLKNAILQKQLAHAFLFCGPRGVGKTTCARILAKTINCENLQPNGEACDRCVSCKTFNEGISLNIHELDAASNNSVEDIRNLTEQVRFPPQLGSYKVYIIDEVHMLSSNAFNAFLKTLEEPPSYAIFILATTEKHKILPTILSRCQIFDFKRITTADTVAHLEEITLKENIQAEKAALEIIAQKSEGCMRDSLSILDKIVSFSGGKLTYQQTIEHLNILDADHFFRLLELMLSQDLSSVMLLYEEINHKGFEGDVVLNSFSEFLRNLLVSKDEKVVSLLEAVESFRDRFLTTAKNISASWIISALNLLNESEIQYKQARNKRLHVEMTLIKLTYLAQALEQTGGKKKLNEPPKPVRFRQLKPYTLVAKKSEAPAASANVNATPSKPATEQIKPVKEIVKDPVVTQPSNKASVPAAPKTLSSPGKLSSIREKIATSIRKEQPRKELESGEVEKAWNLFLEQLRAAKKFSAVTNFEMMNWLIAGEEQLEIRCRTELQMGFLKQEKVLLVDHLQSYFQNPTLTIHPVLTEDPDPELPGPKPLSTREQYLQMSEKYPLVKALRERLGLELEY